MLEAIKAFFRNSALMPALCAWGIAQIIKIITALVQEKKFRFDRIFGDGGMPSGHSATVMALTTASAFLYNFDSFQFAICLIFAIIVMHDATGVRRETGKQANAILLLFNTINSMRKTKDKIEQQEKLKELVGHNHIQVLVGAILGVAVAILYLWIFHVPTALVQF